ncbi:MAG: exodeoxyribonuclease VII small subunit [Defluviicoccus sp.]|nr:exodeoxyribonuclease VII small subunit [Defluviicoccus sp.]MDE0385785.1 exodeoxyribonuclease VII small subunit [Defluviicoccus sp.]
MAETKASEDIANLSFEDALEQLEAIVRTLEGGEARLDDAIGAYERGIALKTHCEAKLGEARARIEKISFQGSEPAGVEPADID